MIDTICFFNFFHNGDLFATREFVSHISNQLSEKYNCYYAHVKNKKVLGDLNIKSYNISEIKDIKSEYHREKIFQINNTLYVNTWIGPYMKSFSTDGISPVTTGVNWLEYYKIWKIIVSAISKKLNINLEMYDNIMDYIPKINYSYYNIDNIHKFLDLRSNLKKIIISNGEVLSGQSYNSFDYNYLINSIASKFLNCLIIVTKKYNTNLDNVFFTDDIIKSNDGCDLNEISYLSTFCDVIIGRNSGPFCFMNTKENIENKNKIIVSLGNREGDNFLYNMNNTKSKWFFYYDNDFNNIKEEIFKCII